MTGLPAADASRAVFIGTGAYANLEDLPAVAENLKRLPEVLADPAFGWLTPATFTTMLDAPNQLAIYDALATQARSATDTLLVYYSGHGALNRQNELHLCPATVRPDALSPSALAYQDVRDIVSDSPARRRIVILDCCFSGRAITMSGADANPRLEIEGTYVLTATTSNRQALSPAGQRYTAFTGALIDLLAAGIPEGPEFLTFATLFPHLSASLSRRAMPQPWQQGTGTIENLALIRNPASACSSDTPRQSLTPSGPLDDLVENSHPAVRAATVAVLGRWLTDSDTAKVQAAHRALLHIGAATDDDPSAR